MLHKLLFIALTSILAISIQGQRKQFIANLSGLQEIPATDSTGKALCRIELINSETEMLYRCDYNLPAGQYLARLYSGGAVGAEGTIFLENQFPINGGNQSPAGFGGVISNITSQQIADLRANRFYFRFVSQGSPNNSIRGQFHLANSAYNDFDGDGRTDLTVYRNSNNTFYALQSLGNVYREQPLGAPGDSVSLTVDFDGDGCSDFSTARYNAEVLWRIRKSTTDSLEETRWGSSTLGDFFAAADYDGDGAFDIAVFRAGVWYIIESSTGNVRYENFGQSGDVPAANDFDGDGRADLTIARSESGQRVWYVRRSTDNSFYNIVWGLSSDAFFTGRTDFDGDGRADLTVIRNESGQRVFYILRSSDSQPEIIRWGLSSDVVKLGDYDGDGKTDTAVTRAVSGQRVFFIRQSSTGELRTETFGLQGDF